MKRLLRGAVYTRKSSEEGLEQAFNSLDAQREACDAFIRSQRHEGWTLLQQAYDDGGFSGGTVERPALQQLLADIRQGRIDVVVCYKVDRLTRSLADFAKIVEIFDQKGVSFVSVTQQFNTTTSMGRLTLNVLLSFAQFEREVTGERIRDKIAASKQKGMWMGGVPPLGYRCNEHKLLTVEAEAETVRHIFRRYAALGSVRPLKIEIDAAGIRAKRWTNAAGQNRGGRPVTRAALYRMPGNRIYRGEIVHKDRHYPGNHEPIIDEALWEKVQAGLAQNAVKRCAGAGCKNPSLLAGLLFDGAGHRLSPTHAVKSGKRYRYYVSQPLVTKVRDDDPDGLRLPAGEIEELAAHRVATFLSDPLDLSEALASHLASAIDQQRLLRRAGDLAAGWSTLPTSQLRPILQRLLHRIEVHDDKVDLQLSPGGIVRFLRGDKSDPEAAFPMHGEVTITLSVPARLRRAGLGMALIVEGAQAQAAKPDPTLVKLVARAQRFREQLLQGDSADISALARHQQLSPSYLTRVLRLGFLAPDIVRAILEGRQPRELTAQQLIGHSRLPLAWSEQRRLLGFA